MFMLVVSGVPSEDNKDASTYAGALIHIWVKTDSAELAQESAYTYIRRYQWNPESVEHVFEIHSEHLPKLGISESRLYHQALQFGIAADFLAWMKDQSRPNDPVQFCWMDQQKTN